jgi:hypothetical protein
VWRLYLNRAVAAGDDAVFESALAYSKHPVMNVHVCAVCCAVMGGVGVALATQRLLSVS